MVFPPPAVPGFRDQEKRQDDLGVWKHLPHALPHALPHGGSPNVPPAAEVHVPKLVLPEPVVPMSRIKVPTSGFSSAAEGSTALFRGVGAIKGGGILAGIGGAFAAVFGGLFGRRKES
jgi:hypothetical protein